MGDRSHVDTPKESSSDRNEQLSSEETDKTLHKEDDSSRGKPEKTQKVVKLEAVENEFFREDLGDHFPLVVKADDSDGIKTTSKAAETSVLGSLSPGQLQQIFSNSFISEKEEDVDLSEGTIFVKPEPVNTPSQNKKNKNASAKSKNRLTAVTGCVKSVIYCTACNHQIGVSGVWEIFKHPILKVLICKKCYNWHKDESKIIKGDDGKDEQCRWCGDGGDLICCDFCNCSFCKSCIRRNLGRKELGDILNAGDDVTWRCYVCNPKPILRLVENFASVSEAASSNDKKNVARERKKFENLKKNGLTSTQFLPQQFAQRNTWADARRGRGNMRTQFMSQQSVGMPFVQQNSLGRVEGRGGGRIKTQFRVQPQHSSAFTMKNFLMQNKTRGGIVKSQFLPPQSSRFAQASRGRGGRPFPPLQSAQFIDGDTSVQSQPSVVYGGGGHVIGTIFSGSSESQFRPPQPQLMLPSRQTWSGNFDNVRSATHNAAQQSDNVRLRNLNTSLDQRNAIYGSSENQKQGPSYRKSSSSSTVSYVRNRSSSDAVRRQTTTDCANVLIEMQKTTLEEVQTTMDSMLASLWQLNTELKSGTTAKSAALEAVRRRNIAMKLWITQRECLDELERVIQNN